MLGTNKVSIPRLGYAFCGKDVDVQSFLSRHLYGELISLLRIPHALKLHLCRDWDTFFRGRTLIISVVSIYLSTRSG